jgi:hypothetical protein
LKNQPNLEIKLLLHNNQELKTHQNFLDSVALVVRLDPADVLATPEAPALQAKAAEVEAVRRAAPVSIFIY